MILKSAPRAQSKHLSLAEKASPAPKAVPAARVGRAWSKGHGCAKPGCCCARRRWLGREPPSVVMPGVPGLPGGSLSSPQGRREPGLGRVRRAALAGRCMSVLLRATAASWGLSLTRGFLCLEYPGVIKTSHGACPPAQAAALLLYSLISFLC